jgi:hypothetical protein
LEAKGKRGYSPLRRAEITKYRPLHLKLRTRGGPVAKVKGGKEKKMALGGL